jgi:hypothetical protein
MFVRFLIAPTLTNNIQPNRTGSITSDKYIGDSGTVVNMILITVRQSFL